MLNATHCKSIVGNEFFKPVFGYLDLSRFSRNCPALTDSLWLEAGIRRCLGLFQSGRDFLQDLSERHNTEILLTTFFASLKSQRRLALLTDILAQLQAHMRRAMPDPFASFKCLDDFDIYAGDGHFIAAASHDKAASRRRPPQNKPDSRTAAFTATKYATGHLYSLDLRSHGIVALLYKSRWDVEKVFDEFKNKLGETKSWASTANAKTCQARLLCLTHNLMTLMEEQIYQESGIRNETENKRKSKVLAKRDAQSKSNGGGGLTLLQQCIQRLTQRTVKFIRWLKNHLDSERSWKRALASLAKIYAHS